MKTWQCDKDNDCDDAVGDELSSDEKNCSMYFVPITEIKLHHSYRVSVCHIVVYVEKSHKTGFFRHLLHNEQFLTTPEFFLLNFALTVVAVLLQMILAGSS
jgi:hypothetical protein